MSKSFPFKEPIETLLSLTQEDKCLGASFQTSSIPPRSLDEACFLTHYIIRQSCYVGTHILDHLLRNPPGDSAHLAPLMLYRHSLELGDSIGTLLRYGSATTASILVRSLFETSLGLEFILQDDTAHEDRASCFQAFYQIGRWKNFIRYDPATKEGQELHQILDNDPKLCGVPFPRRNLSEERSIVEKVLNSPRYKSHWDKYQTSIPKPKHWYTLSNSDITHLRALAKAVGREGEYVLLYRLLSGSAHASDVFSGVLEHGGGRSIRVHRLRGPVEKIKEATSLAASFLVWSHHRLLNTYLKGHGVQTWFSHWYVEDYSEFFNWAITPGPLITQPPPQV